MLVAAPFRRSHGQGDRPRAARGARDLTVSRRAPETFLFLYSLSSLI
jgi:hypothetical protein